MTDRKQFMVSFSENLWAEFVGCFPYPVSGPSEALETAIQFYIYDFRQRMEAASRSMRILPQHNDGLPAALEQTLTSDGEIL